MTETEKAIRDFCGHHADWWPSTTQVQEMLALAQPAQESLEYWNAVEGWVKIDEVRQHFDSVGCGTIYKTSGEDRVPIYTTPPQRTWVGLTDEEIYGIGFDINVGGLQTMKAYKAIEAKLRSKNHD